MKKSGLRLAFVLASLAVLILPSLSLAARFVTVISLDPTNDPNGLASLSATGGKTVPISVAVSITNNSLWRSTGWLYYPITPPSNAVYNCVNTEDFSSNTSHTAFFNTAAPAAPGLYNLYIKTYSDGSADGTCTTGDTGSGATTAILLVDNTPPSAFLFSNAPEQINGPISVTAVFTKSISSFSTSAVHVSGGSADSSSLLSNGDRTAYTFSVIPKGDGVVSISIPAGGATDIPGNPSLESNTLTREYSTSRPNLALCANIACDSVPRFVDGPFLLRINSTDALIDFTPKSITVTNGAVSAFTEVSPTDFTLTVTPFAPGPVIVEVKENTAHTVFGNGNKVGAVFSTSYFPPHTISLDAGPAEGEVVYGATASFSFLASSEGVNECALDGGGFNTCTSPFTLENLPEGAHTVTIRPRESPEGGVTRAFTSVNHGSITLQNSTSDSDSATSFLFHLQDTGDSVHDYTLTGNGSQKIDSLVPGSYTLSSELPSDWTGTQSATCVGNTTYGPLSGPLSGLSITLSAGESVTCTVNNSPNAILSGMMYEDMHGDGKTIGDTALSGWELTARSLGEDGTSYTATSDSDGHYQFSVPSGTYSVCETLQDGWKQSSTSLACYTSVSVASGASNPTLDFGNWRPSSVTGLLFHDANGNGAQDDTEIGEKNFTITLLGTPDTLTAKTAEDGTYTFTDLPPGNYTVSAEPQDDWSFTTSTSTNITLLSGTPQSHSFGAAQSVSFGGVVWNDTDADTIIGTSEPTFSSREVTLTPTFIDQTPDTSRTTLATTTDTNGRYSFTIPPSQFGYFLITPAPQSGWVQTSPVNRDPFALPINDDTPLGTPYNFGFAQFREVQGAIFVPKSVEGTSTLSVQTLAATSTVNILETGGATVGTSTVIIPPLTTIAKADGSNLDLDAFTAGKTNEKSLSGLGQGVVADSALQWGIPGEGLVFSSPITISIYVGLASEGKQLKIFRSPQVDAGWTQDGIVAPGFCIVQHGICSFQATHASYYVATHNTNVADAPSPSATSGGGTVAGPLAAGYQAPTTDNNETEGVVLGAETSKPVATSSVSSVVYTNSTTTPTTTLKILKKQSLPSTVRPPSKPALHSEDKISEKVHTEGKVSVGTKIWSFIISLFHW